MFPVTVLFYSAFIGVILLRYFMLTSSLEGLLMVLPSLDCTI